MTRPQLRLDPSHIASYRIKVGALDRRLPSGADALRRIAWAGVQDSWPRSAVLSIHARMSGSEPHVWSYPSLTQVWGPRFNVYVVTEQDAPVFTIGRQPSKGAKRDLGIELADRLDALLDGEAIPYRDAGRALGVNPNQLRYAAPTGRLRVRWEGAGPPLVNTVPEPETDPGEARRELARRFLHVLGPSTVSGFARWAGVAPRHATETFDELRTNLISVGTSIGDAFILADDADSFHADATTRTTPSVRFLPGGDNFVLRWGLERRVQVDDDAMRAALWPARVWPGALLIDGEIVGTWRRSGSALAITPWREVGRQVRIAVEHEAGTLPLARIDGDLAVTWTSPLCS